MEIIVGSAEGKGKEEGGRGGGQSKSPVGLVRRREDLHLVLDLGINAIEGILVIMLFQSLSLSEMR